MFGKNSIIVAHQKPLKSLIRLCGTVYIYFVKRSLIMTSNVKNFGDVMGAVEDMIKVFSDPKEDLNSIRSVQVNLEEMTNAFQQKENSVKEIMRGILRI